MPTPARPPDPESSVAVLFGFSRYTDHQPLPGLPAVSRGVTGLADLLTNTDTGGFARENCLVRTDDISVEDFGIQFEQYAARARDVLLVYYCGHGILDTSPYTGRLYLAFPRTRKDHFHFSALALRDVRRVIAGSQARNKVLILDCCYSGQAHTQGGPTDLRDQIEIEGTYTLSSASGLDIAMAPPGAKYTAFTGALLHALDESTRSPYPVPIREVFSHVSTLMRPHGLSAPSQSVTHTADQIALVRPGQPRPAPPVAPPEPSPPRFEARESGLALPPQSTWADAGVLELVQQSLNDRTRAYDIEHGIDGLADRLHTALAAVAEPIASDGDADLAITLARLLDRYEGAVGPMLRVLAFGGRYGEPRHDAIWARVLERILNRRHTRPMTLRPAFASAERYPALLLATALGTGAVAASRPDLIYRILTEVSYKPPHTQSAPALLALTPIRVIAPDVAARLPGWHYEPTDLAVSAHMRKHLRGAFDGILGDSDYPRLFAAYEYLRSLLEFDAAGFSSSGLFTEAPGTSGTDGFRVDLTERSSLLKAGAFGGDMRRADRARHRVDASLQRDSRPG